MRIFHRLHNDIIVASLGVLFILTVIAVSFLEFADECFAYTFDTYQLRLGEIATQNCDAVRIEFLKANEIVTSTALALSYYDELISPSSFEFLEKQARLCSFEKFCIVTPDGKAYGSVDEFIDVSFQDYYMEVARGVCGITRREDRESACANQFFVSAPIMRNNAFGGAIVGIYQLDSLSLMETDPAYSGMGYFHIFDPNGDLIINAKPQECPIDNDNFLDFFKKADYANGFSYDKLDRSIAKRQRVSFTYRDDGKEVMAYLAPMGINDWLSLTIGPEEVVQSFSSDINSLAAMLALKFSLCFTALILGIVHFGDKSRQRTLEINRKLSVSNQRFRIAAFQLSGEILEYQIEPNRLYRFHNNRLEESGNNPVENLRTELISGVSIDKEYVRLVESVLENLRKGREYQTCIVKAQTANGERKWFKLSFTTIFVDDRRPEQAIGTIEDITQQKEAEINFTNKERQRLAMLSDAMETLVFNITKERYLYGYNSNDTRTDRRDTLYGSRLQLFIDRNVHPDYRERVKSSLSAPYLLEVHEKGHKRVEMEFRGMHLGRGERWLRCTTYLVDEPESGDVMGYAYIVDISHAKETERTLKYQAERDELTGLYNRNAAQKMVTAHLREMDPAAKTRFAFFLIDLDDFKTINDTYGHGAGDEALQKMAKQLTSVFRSTDIVARLGGDEFFVFMTDASEESIVTARAEKLCASLKSVALSFAPEHRIRASVGITVVDRPGQSWKRMYESADNALYRAKRSGKDQFCVSKKVRTPHVVRV